MEGAYMSKVTCDSLPVEFGCMGRGGCFFLLSVFVSFPFAALEHIAL